MEYIVRKRAVVPTIDGIWRKKQMFSGMKCPPPKITPTNEIVGLIWKMAEKRESSASRTLHGP